MKSGRHSFSHCRFCEPVNDESMTVSSVSTGMPSALPRAFAVAPRLARFTFTHRLGGLGFLRLTAQLVERGQVALAHRLDKALEGYIGDADQAEMAVFTIQQTPGDRLVQVLEPVHPDNRRLGHRLLEEGRIRGATVFFAGQLRHAAPERATVGRAKVEFGDQYRFVQRTQRGAAR